MLQSIQARLLVILAAAGVTTLAVHQRGLALTPAPQEGLPLALGLSGEDETHPDEERDELIRRAERVVRSRLEERIAEEPRFRRGSSRLIGEVPGPLRFDVRARPGGKRPATPSATEMPPPALGFAGVAPPRIEWILVAAGQGLEAEPLQPELPGSEHSWISHGPTAGRPPPVR